MSNVEFSGKQRVGIADILYEHYSETDQYGKDWIYPLPEKVEGVFGEALLTYNPVYPRKKIRDFFKSLDSDCILQLIAELSVDDGTDNSAELMIEINDILAQVGLEIDKGEVIHLAEKSLHLFDDEVTFLTKLDTLGYVDIKDKYDKGMDAFRKGNLSNANSLSCLAFDGLFKKVIISNGLTVRRESLGKLVEIAVKSNIIEPETKTVFLGLVSLRNRAPQHASATGSVQSLSNESTMLIVHLTRILGAYLLSLV